MSCWDGGGEVFFVLLMCGPWRVLIFHQNFSLGSFDIVCAESGGVHLWFFSLQWCFRKSVDDLSTTCQYRPLPEHHSSFFSFFFFFQSFHFYSVEWLVYETTFFSVFSRSSRGVCINFTCFSGDLSSERLRFIFFFEVILFFQCLPPFAV